MDNDGEKRLDESISVFGVCYTEDALKAEINEAIENGNPCCGAYIDALDELQKRKAEKDR